MKLGNSGDCSGRLCGYGAFDDGLGCDSGPGTCWVAYLLEAEESSFHDETLQNATQQIKKILDDIPADREGRKLSFVHTKQGTLLAWVQHGVSFPEGTVTIEDGHDELMRALKIRTSSLPEAC
jgi:hypothetical protein